MQHAAGLYVVMDVRETTVEIDHARMLNTKTIEFVNPVIERNDESPHKAFERVDRNADLESKDTEQETSMKTEQKRSVMYTS